MITYKSKTLLKHGDVLVPINLNNYLDRPVKFEGFRILTLYWLFMLLQLNWIRYFILVLEHVKQYKKYR